MGCLAATSSCAWADTEEASVRCGPAVRRTRAEVDGRDETAWLGGGACILGLGLSPTFTVTARYDYSASGSLRVASDVPEKSQVFHFVRHDLTAGLAWAPTDVLTPILGANLGATSAAIVDRQWRLETDEGERRVGPDLADTQTWQAMVHIDALLEWRFREFWSVSGGFFGEWAGAPGFGASVYLAGYRYL